MKLRIVMLGLLLVSGFVLGGPTGATAGEKYPPDIERILKRGKLLVLVDREEAFPCIMKDEAGNLYGLDIDIARNVADKLGVTLALIRSGSSGDEKVAMVARGDADMAMALGITPQRAQNVLFTQPYLSEHFALVVNRLLDARFGGEAYGRLLDGKSRLAVLRGSVYASQAKRLFSRSELVLCDHRDECLREVLAGRAHAYLTEEFETIYHFFRHPENAVKLKTIVLKDYPLLGGIAVAWDSQHFHAWLNLYLELNDHDHSVAGMVRRYLPASSQQ